MRLFLRGRIGSGPDGRAHGGAPSRPCGAPARRLLAGRVAGLLGSGLSLITAAQLLPWRVGVVWGHSMEPTLPAGAVVLFDPGYCRTHRVRPGDVVILRVVGTPCVKRVYATGGERFWAWAQADAGEVRHSPIRAAQRARFERLAAHDRARFQGDERVVLVRVPPRCLFVMGDGAQSEDSRQFGFVPEDQLLGRVQLPPGRRAAWRPESAELSFPVGRREVRTALR